MRALKCLRWYLSLWRRFPAGDMIPQALSTLFWAAVKPQDVAPVVLRALLLSEFPGKAGDMILQALSNSLWATAKLQDVAPEVLSIVSAHVEIPAKASDMISQDLSNILWAAANLHKKEMLMSSRLWEWWTPSPLGTQLP